MAAVLLDFCVLNRALQDQSLQPMGRPQFPVGWCAPRTVCSGHVAAGSWTGPHLHWHISCLKLMEVLLALRRFRPLIQYKHVLVCSDTTMAIPYINHQGGLRFLLQAFFVVSGCLMFLSGLLLHCPEISARLCAQCFYHSLSRLGSKPPGPI